MGVKGKLTSKSDGGYLLIGPATANVAVVSRKPDLSEVRIVVFLASPHGHVEWRAPLIESDSVKGMLHSRMDVETFKPDLESSLAGHLILP